MRSVFLSGLVVAGLAGLSGFGRASEDADAILAKAVAAHGGEEALAKYPGVRMKLQVIIEGPAAAPRAWEVLFAAPASMREVREGFYLGRRTASVAVTDGKGYWWTNGGQTEAMPAKQAESFRDRARLMQITRLVPLKGKDYELSAAGDATVDDKPAVGLRVRSKGRKDVTLFFDKESGLLVKAALRTISTSTLEEVLEERFYQDYQKTGPLPVAKKVVVLHDGKPNLRIEVQETKFLEKTEKGAFRR
jgi:hypothetical protein